MGMVTSIEMAIGDKESWRNVQVKLESKCRGSSVNSREMKDDNEGGHARDES